MGINATYRNDVIVTIPFFGIEWKTSDQSTTWTPVTSEELLVTNALPAFAGWFWARGDLPPVIVFYKDLSINIFL